MRCLAEILDAPLDDALEPMVDYAFMPLRPIDDEHRAWWQEIWLEWLVRWQPAPGRRPQ